MNNHNNCDTFLSGFHWWHNTEDALQQQMSYLVWLWIFLNFCSAFGILVYWLQPVLRRLGAPGMNHTYAQDSVQLYGWHNMYLPSKTNWWLHHHLLCIGCLQNLLQLNVKKSVSILQKRACLLSRIVKPAASNLGLIYFSTVIFHLENKLHKLVNHVSISWGASQKSIFLDAIIAALS